jgi:seryl-tRNA synthetase
MLDRKFIVENAAAVKENCARRNSKADIDRFVELEAKRRRLQQEGDELNRQANETAKLIGKADPAERERLKTEGRQLRDRVTAAQTDLATLETEIDALQRTIPNMSHPAAPIGGDDQSNLVVRKGKHSPPILDFTPLDHVVLGEKLDLIDFEAGAKTTGAGFYFLKNEAVLLELALQQYAVHLLMNEGFTPMITPDLAKNEVLHGTGYFHVGP